MDKLQIYLIEIAELFGYKYDDFFFDYLKSISIPNKSKCGRQIIRGEGGWKCRDCEFETYSIYCIDCFIKEKHIGHKILFRPNASGFCDCGERLILKSEGFCDKHKGDFDNIKDLMKFIKSSVNENLLSPINDILNKIFLLFIEKIKDKTDENEDEIYKMIDTLEIFCDKLYKNNLGLFYFVTLKFIENIPLETNHKCFSFDENKKVITFVKKDENVKHICTCPFLQVIIYFLMKRKTKQDSSKFFNLFLQTYKNQIITSLCFLNCFTELFDNENLKSLRQMGYQLVNQNISQLLYKEENLPFLEFFFEEIYSKYKKFLEEKSYFKVYKLSYEFYRMTKYIPTESIIDKMNSEKKILKIIIDICCLINHSLIFENKVKFKQFQNDGYNRELFNAEIYIILTIISLSHILDFNNQEVINFLFNSIFEKLFEIKKNKEISENKFFSPHITIIKFYSIILNRFCYNYSIKNECDLLDSFNYFQNIFPQSKELNIFLFEELIKFFGFMISQRCSFFVYFGKGMANYYFYYFDNDLQNINVDISLMKYLMSLPEIKEQFNLQKIISLSDIDSSNNIFNELTSDNLEKIQTDYINSQKNNLDYINSVIEFLYLIIRENLSLENIAFQGTNFKWKMKDEIYEQLYQKDKEKVNILVKNNIIHFILGKNNLVQRKDCLDHLMQIFDGKYIELIDEILKENCEKIILTNGLIEFSLKKTILNLCDIDYIMDHTNRKNAIKYMINFQSSNNFLSNIKIIEPLCNQIKFMKNIYQTFYNEKNVDELIKLYNLIFSYKEKFPLLNEIFYSNITKILSFAYKLCFTQLLDEDYKLKLLEKISKLQDKELLKKLGENSADKNHCSDNKKNMKSLKDKLKKKFEKKNELIKEQIIPSNMIIEEEIQNEDEKCVYCRQSLKIGKNNIEYYGKICYYFSDYLTEIMRKKPEGERKKARKFVSCNHKMHFKCFNEFIVTEVDFEKKEFICPLCKKLSNIILFDYSFLKENDNIDLIKGINYGTEIKEFYKNDEDNKYQSLISSNILTFENYCSKICHEQILIKDINSDRKLEGKIFEAIINDFEEFSIYYNLTNNKQEQIEIWKNILFNLRFLYQYKIITFSDNMIQLLELFKIENVKIFEEFLNIFPINEIINRFIIISIILLNSSKENREKIKNIFNQIILPFIIYIAFNKSNDKTFEDYMNNNKIELTKVIELYKLKYKIFLLLFNEIEEDINLNISFDQILLYIKSNQYFNELYQTKNDNFSKIEQNLELPELNLAILPQKGIDFLNMTNRYCFYCHKRNLSSYFCLLCGNQICNNINCFIDDKLKGKKEYSLIYHSKKCCGGNGLFIDVSNGEIVFILKRQIIGSGIHVYLNNFGEHIKKTDMNDEYILNKAELQKGIMKYIDLSFRKKSGKIRFRNMDDNNE